MRMSLGTIVTAGLLASISVVLFLFMAPTILGMGPIDITRDIGTAFSLESPRLIGTVVMAILGILYAAIFAQAYKYLPGQFVAKGIVYGFLVALFSIYVLPGILTAIIGALGTTGEYTANATMFSSHFMMTVLAYLVFGITLSATTKPAEGEA